jgi:hypothetical protein
MGIAKTENGWVQIAIGNGDRISGRSEAVEKPVLRRAFSTGRTSRAARFKGNGFGLYWGYSSKPLGFNLLRNLVKQDPSLLRQLDAVPHKDEERNELFR